MALKQSRREEAGAYRKGSRYVRRVRPQHGPFRNLLKYNDRIRDRVADTLTPEEVLSLNTTAGDMVSNKKIKSARSAKIRNKAFGIVSQRESLDVPYALATMNRTSNSTLIPIAEQREMREIIENDGLCVTKHPNKFRSKKALIECILKVVFRSTTYARSRGMQRELFETSFGVFTRSQFKRTIENMTVRQLKLYLLKHTRNREWLAETGRLAPPGYDDDDDL